MGTELLYNKKEFDEEIVTFSLVNEDPLVVLKEMFPRYKIARFYDIRIDSGKGFHISPLRGITDTNLESVLSSGHKYLSDSKVRYTEKELDSIYNNMLFSNFYSDKDNFKAVMWVLGRDPDKALNDLNEKKELFSSKREPLANLKHLPWDKKNNYFLK